MEAQGTALPSAIQRPAARPLHAVEPPAAVEPGMFRVRIDRPGQNPRKYPAPASRAAAREAHYPAVPGADSRPYFFN